MFEFRIVLDPRERHTGRSSIIAVYNIGFLRIVAT
jgi:hypothetical protein